jgi:hypothetical protein
MHCIERLGHKVEPFDTSKYLFSGHRLIRSIGWRLNRGPYINKFNNDLVKKVRNLNNIDLIWVDKGNWIKAYTLKKCSICINIKK